MLVNNLTPEQLHDLIDAVKHYQYHHISINNSRFDEFSNILNIIAKELKNEDLYRQCEHT